MISRSQAHRHAALLNEPCSHCATDDEALGWPDWLIVTVVTAALALLLACLWLVVVALGGFAK